MTFLIFYFVKKLLYETVQKSLGHLGRKGTFFHLWPQDVISVQRVEKLQVINLFMIQLEGKASVLRKASFPHHY